MNESQHNILSLNILGKIYQIKCPQDKVAELREAAQYLETKMRETVMLANLALIDLLLSPR